VTGENCALNSWERKMTLAGGTEDMSSSHNQEEKPSGVKGGINRQGKSEPVTEISLYPGKYKKKKLTLRV